MRGETYVLQVLLVFVFVNYSNFIVHGFLKIKIRSERRLDLNSNFGQLIKNVSFDTFAEQLECGTAFLNNVQRIPDRGEMYEWMDF